MEAREFGFQAAGSWIFIIPPSKSGGTGGLESVGFNRDRTTKLQQPSTKATPTSTEEFSSMENWTPLWISFTISSNPWRPLVPLQCLFHLLCVLLNKHPADLTLKVFKQVPVTTHREQKVVDETLESCAFSCLKHRQQSNISSAGCVRGPAHHVPPSHPQTGQGASHHLLTPPVQHIPDREGNEPTCPT